MPSTKVPKNGTAPSDLRPGETIDGDCQLCGRTRLKVLPFRYDYHRRPLYGVACLNCGLTFLHPMLPDDEIRDLYKEEYFTECSETCGAHGPRAYMEMIEESAGERRSGALRLDRALTRYRKGRGKLIEVGCGPGYLLAELRTLGWEVAGLEISEFAAREAQQKLGLDVRVGPITPEAFAAGSADAVFMGDVLEHLPRPLESLKAVRAWLKPEGLVAIAVPSTLNLLSAQIGFALYKTSGRFKVLRIPPYHLFEYTPRTLRAMLRAAGFEVVMLSQGAVPIRRMGLRNSALENAGKVSLQLLAHATSRLFNAGGDRLLALGRKPAA